MTRIADFHDLLFAITAARTETDMVRLGVIADRVIRTAEQWEVFGRNMGKRCLELGSRGG